MTSLKRNFINQLFHELRHCFGSLLPLKKESLPLNTPRTCKLTPAISQGSASRHEGFFIIDVLDSLPDGAIDLIHELEDIFQKISVQGAQEGYINRLKRIIDQLRGRDSRDISPGPSSKRRSDTTDMRASKRQMK